MSGRETIISLASGAGRAAISVIRLSGPGTATALSGLLRGALPSPRRASLRTLRDPFCGDVLDRALVLWMPGPASFTGEDQAELHLHGGLAVRAAVIGALGAMPGCRTAEPGEFTRRAFLNGRLDLTAVEGLADLIDAETETQRRQALRQMDGALAREAAGWRDELLEAVARSEATLDFSDEDDVPPSVAVGVFATASQIRDAIGTALAGAARGERVRDGYVVVLAGWPNAGKSTLLNAIARRDVAIVSPLPGTTRDAIEVRCDLGGFPVVLVDTAGVRDSPDPIEQQGVARARARMGTADLVLWLTAADAPSEPDLKVDPARLMLVGTKADLCPPSREVTVSISAETGAGIPALLAAVQARAEAEMGGGSDVVLTRERHRAVLSEVAACLDRAVMAGQDAPAELLAEDLRLALRALGRMTGEVGVEDVLDRIFASFCIGK